MDKLSFLLQVFAGFSTLFGVGMFALALIMAFRKLREIDGEG